MRVVCFTGLDVRDPRLGQASFPGKVVLRQTFNAAFVANEPSE
jgi:hypothetical protein